MTGSESKPSLMPHLPLKFWAATWSRFPQSVESIEKAVLLIIGFPCSKWLLPTSFQHCQTSIQRYIQRLIFTSINWQPPDHSVPPSHKMPPWFLESETHCQWHTSRLRWRVWHHRTCGSYGTIALVELVWYLWNSLPVVYWRCKGLS